MKSFLIASPIFVSNFFEENEINDRKVDGRSQPRPGKSNLHGRKDYCNSTWGRMLLDDKDQLMKFDSAEAKLFRLRFRVPYKLFIILLDWTEAFIESKEKTRDCTGRPKVPISLKLLGVLRILGRGICYDGIKELSDMSETTIWNFFHTFCAWFREDIYPKFVKKPRSPAIELL